MEITPASVLVIERYPLMRAALCAAIASEPDFQMAEPRMADKVSLKRTPANQPETLLLASRPDVILLALGYPGYEELKALRRLRRSLPGTPILALTSNEVEGQEQAAAQAGAQIVLTKAVSQRELLQALRELRTLTDRTQEDISPEQEATV